MKYRAVVLLAGALLATTLSAQAQSEGSREMSEASAFMAEGSAVVVAGSMSALAGAGKVVVKGLEASGDVVTVVLAGASEGVEASVRLSGKAAKGLSVAAGTVVSVSVISSGYLLVASGQVLAFVPNELGKALFHHSPVQA